MNLLSSYSNEDIVEEAINRGFTKSPAWLQVFPRESEMSLFDVEALNKLISDYCLQNGIHKNG